jgi:midasin
VEYLAERTGHRFVRINNHEHTDLQEYLGSYVTDAEGTSRDPRPSRISFP